MPKYRKCSIAMIAILALMMSLIPSTAFGATRTVKAVSGLEVDQMSNTSAELNWNYVNGSEGYKVYKATSRTGKYTLVKTITRGKKTSFTSKNLELGKTYYYKVKAIDTVNGRKILSRKFSNIGSVKMEQCIPDYTIEFPKKLNEDGTLTVTVTNKSKKEIQLAAMPLIFKDLNDWSKDGILLKAIKYENPNTEAVDTEYLNFPYPLLAGEAVKVTYELDKELQGTLSGIKGEEAPTAINYKEGGEGFAIGITYRNQFFYMAIQYPDGQKLMTLDEYLQKALDAVDMTE